MSFKKQFKEELIDKNVWHCLNDVQIESIASMGEQQLQLYLVSYRRELLIAYSKYLEEQELRGFDCYIDDFLKVNSN